MITQDSTHRFVTDTEKTNWNDNISQLESHAEDGTIHITEDERNSWNSKVSDSSLHAANTTMHITAAERTTWNNTLRDAKTYTDTKIGELIDSAPETMDTLKEVADAIAAHQDITDALNSAIGNKADGTNGVANNASKLNGQAASYYAKAADLTTANTNISNIVDGTTTVAKATSAGTCTGNAATATKATQLANSRTINGVSFNGTANITVPIVTSGTTAPSNTTLLWLDTNYTPNLLKFYNGSSWQALNTYQ